MAETGRLYRVLAELTYAGATLAPDALDAFVQQVRRTGGLGEPAFGLRASGQHTVLVTATVRQTDPVAALADFNGALDRALLTGLFEEFDVTGKVMRLAPAESAERVYWTHDQVWQPLG